MSKPMLEACHVMHRFPGSAHALLEDFNLQVHHGEKLALVGRSGSGKTTLLHLLSGLSPLQSGTVTLNGQSLQQLSQRAMATLRNTSIGFVYQNFHLLKDFTAIENIAMVLRIQGIDSGIALAKASACMQSLDIADLADSMPQQLSGGEKQRVAIARAIINQPAILFADEPTGNLDQDNAKLVMQAIDKLQQSHQMTLIMATHDRSLLPFFDKCVEIC